MANVSWKTDTSQEERLEYQKYRFVRLRRHGPKVRSIGRTSERNKPRDLLKQSYVVCDNPCTVLGNQHRHEEHPILRVFRGEFQTAAAIRREPEPVAVDDALRHQARYFGDPSGADSTAANGFRTGTPSASLGFDVNLDTRDVAPRTCSRRPASDGRAL